MNTDITDFISYLTIKKGLSKNTVRHFTCRYPVVKKYLDERKLPLTKESIEQFLYDLKQLGRSNACLNTYIIFLQHYERYLNDRGGNYRFMEDIKCLRKSQPDIQILSIEELDRLLNTKLTYGVFHGEDHSEELDFVYSTFAMALAFTGARFSEMQLLKVKYFDSDIGKVTFVDTKNGDVRRVDVPEPLKVRMKELCIDKDQNDYVFTNSNNHTLHSTDYSQDLKRRAKQAGIDAKRVYPHLLRHSFATHLLQYGANVDISMVATILGHKDIQTTYKTYLHLADDTIRKSHFSHPLIRKHSEPKDIIKNLAETIEKFKLDTDDRLGFTWNRGNNSLTFSLYVK